MFYNVKEGSVEIQDTYMDYVSFGRGEEILVMIPGLSVKEIRGTGFFLAHMYRIFAKDYKVYMFDRKKVVPEGYTVKDIADDTAYVMKQLGIEKANVFGVSQGGMIGQMLAINYPEMVSKLVLGVTLSKQNDVVERVVGQWITYAKAGNYQAINRDTFMLMYSDVYLKKNKLFMPIAVELAKPKDLNKFAILAKACLTFDAYDELDKIKCPVLVLGGKKDKVVTGEASQEIAEKLNCEIHMYDDLGHAAYDEAKDFSQRILDFLKG